MALRLAEIACDREVTDAKPAALKDAIEQGACVRDEVDAPLVDAKIERCCVLLDAMVGETDTRYLSVTHNAVSMSRMHRLFGVTMVEKGVSRLVGVDLGGEEELL